MIDQMVNLMVSSCPLGWSARGQPSGQTRDSHCPKWREPYWPVHISGTVSKACPHLFWQPFPSFCAKKNTRLGCRGLLACAGCTISGSWGKFAGFRYKITQHALRNDVMVCLAASPDVSRKNIGSRTWVESSWLCQHRMKISHQKYIQYLMFVDAEQQITDNHRAIELISAMEKMYIQNIVLFHIP